MRTVDTVGEKLTKARKTADTVYRTPKRAKKTVDTVSEKPMKVSKPPQKKAKKTVDTVSEKPTKVRKPPQKKAKKTVDAVSEKPTKVRKQPRGRKTTNTVRRTPGGKKTQNKSNSRMESELENAPHAVTTEVVNDCTGSVADIQEAMINLRTELVSKRRWELDLIAKGKEMATEIRTLELVMKAREGELEFASRAIEDELLFLREAKETLFRYN